MRFKKIFAAVCAAAVALSSFTFTASAADTPSGTKVTLKENTWDNGDGTKGSNWQESNPISIEGITNWTTTAAEAAEIIGDNEVTVTFTVAGALCDGAEFDASKLSFEGLAQTNGGLWKTYSATKSGDTYTISMSELGKELSASSGTVNLAVVISASKDDADKAVDVYLDNVVVKCGGGSSSDVPSGTKVTLKENTWDNGDGTKGSNWQESNPISIEGITNWTTTAAEAAEIIGDNEVTVTFTVTGALCDGAKFDASKLSFEGLAQTNGGLWKTYSATKSGDTYTISMSGLGKELSASSGTVNLAVVISASKDDADKAVDVYLDNVVVKCGGGSSSDIPSGTKVTLKENTWDNGDGTKGSNWQESNPISIEGITNWTTTAAEAAEIIGDNEVTVTFTVTGALCDGAKFDASKLSFEGLAQTNGGLWKTYSATKSGDTYTISMSGLGKELSASSGTVNLAVVISASKDDADKAVDVYLDNVVVKCGGSSSEEPGTYEITFDKSKDIELSVGDASWGAPTFTKAAQNNFAVTVEALKGKTYAEVKGSTLTLSGVDYSGYTLPDGLTAGDIYTALYIKWGTDGSTWTSSVTPWTIDGLENVADTDTIFEIGYQININGNFAGIDDMEVGGKVTLPLKDSGNTGTDTPGDPGTSDPGTSNPGSAVGTLTPPSTSDNTDKEDKTTFEDKDNKTDIKVDAPKDAFDKPEDIKFNAVPVVEETKDETFTFDLSFTDKDGNKVQPKTAVTVCIPVPAALTGKTIFVYHVENDGKYTEVSCKIENGMIVFSASSFSKYVITSQKLTANGEPAPADGDNSSAPGTTDPGSTGGSTNPGTGVAISLLPLAIAAAGVVVFKKRK